MNYRLNKPAIALLGLFILLALALFAHTMKKSSMSEEEVITEQVVQEESADRAQIITAKHDYVDGTHIVAGEIELPSVCDKLEANPFFVDGSDTNVEIQFTTVNESGEECEQSLTPARFKVEFEGPADAAFSATLNGEGIVLNLVEVPEGEDLESFDEFIKG